MIRVSTGGESASVADRVVREEPLEIRIRGESVAVTMRTPGHDGELAAGFLWAEGIVRQRAEVIELAHCRQSDPEAAENILNVFLRGGVEWDKERLARHFFASSSCGVCGRAAIEAMRRSFPRIASSARMTARVLAELPERLGAAQAQFHQTGGLHAAGLFDLGGNLLLAREDVGRHNAVDKLMGRGFLDGQLPFAQHVLLVSGRVSFEIVQKALAGGVPLVAAISAPSSLAIEFAQEHGQTLVGFLRGSTFNIYTHPERVCWEG